MSDDEKNSDQEAIDKNLNEAPQKKAKIDKKEVKKRKPKEGKEQKEPPKKQVKKPSKQENIDSDESDGNQEPQVSNEITQITQKPGKKEKKQVQKKAPQSKPAKKAAGGNKAKQPLIKEDAEALLNYFKEKNRPFTLNFLKDTLMLKAAGLQKNIDQLIKSGDLIMKEIGSSRIYLVNQQLMPQVNQQEMDQLAQTLELQNEELKGLNEKNQKINDQIKVICRAPRLQDIIKEIESLNEQMNAKMAQYQDSNFQKIPEEEVIQIETEHEKIQNICKKRKKIYKDAIGQILGDSEMTVQQFEAMIGIQRDLL